MDIAATVSASLASRLRRLYGSHADSVLPKLLDLMASAGLPPSGNRAGWSQRDCVLITYGDQVQEDGSALLAALRDFLLAHQLDELINTVHLLPFFPSSSDDGFAVIDYQQVDPYLGAWGDVSALGQHFQLMFDLVLNHISQKSSWFQHYLDGTPPYDKFFIEVDPAADLSDVTRPRSLPLLTPFETSNGTRHVWTTFSADQIDLNYANPQVLLRMIEVLLDYVGRGARILRLDAVAYLWKQTGTPCIHLDETHEVVKLIRDVLQAVAPQVLLLTETNVPHAENISYFGQGDEAQLVYQFSLPPLLLDALVNEDAAPLARWLADLQAPPAGTTFFNFTASHDGVGVRPLEGLVPAERLAALVRWIQARGGLVSTRRRADGSHSPYELNVSYVDALGTPDGNRQMQARRFLTSQAVMLALQGMPGVYFHSLVGTQNDLAGVEQTGQARRINRHKYQRRELEDALQRAGSVQQRIFTGYQHLLRQRISQAAFHPEAAQRVVHTPQSSVLAFVRDAVHQQILVLVNMSGGNVSMDWSTLPRNDWRHELIANSPVDTANPLVLAPYQAVWLSCDS